MFENVVKTGFSVNATVSDHHGFNDSIDGLGLD